MASHPGSKQNPKLSAIGTVLRPKDNKRWRLSCRTIRVQDDCFGISTTKKILREHKSPSRTLGGKRKDLVSQLEYHDIVHRRTPKSQGREKRGSIGCNNVELKRSEFVPHYRVQYTVLAQWIVCHPTKVRDLGSNPKRGAIYAISSVGRAQISNFQPNFLYFEVRKTTYI